MAQSSVPHVTCMHRAPQHGASGRTSLGDGRPRTPSSSARVSHTVKPTALGTFLEAETFLFLSENLYRCHVLCRSPNLDAGAATLGYHSP